MHGRDQPGGDEPRDPVLRAALRHAPDADLLPPEVLSARILAAAHDAVHAKHATPARPATDRAPLGRTASWRGRMAATAARAWAATARPSFAGGFATVVVATLAGVLWWQRPLEETPPPDRARDAVPSPVASNQTTPAATAEPKPQASATPAPAPANAAALRVAPESERAPRPTSRTPDAFPSTPAAPFAAQSRAQAKAAERPADRRAAREAGSDASREGSPPKPPASPPDRVTTDRVAPSPEGATAKLEASKDRVDAPVEARATAPSAPPTDLSAQRRVAPAEERAGGSASAESNPPAGALQRLAPPAPRPTSRLAEAQSSLAMRSASPKLAASPMPSDVASLRAGMDAEPERWSWSRSGDPVVHVSDAARAWLARAEAARIAAADTALAKAAPPGQPSPLGAPPAAAANALREMPELRLFRDGRLAATVRMRGSVLELTDIAGAVHPTPLDPDAAEALAASMPR
jgi:hypothetical protein